MINDKFSLDSDAYNWILREHHTKGRDTLSYYGDLDTVCRAVVNKGLDTEGTMESLHTRLTELHMDLVRMIKKHNLDVRRLYEGRGKI